MPFLAGASRVVPGRALVVTSVGLLSLAAWLVLWLLGGSPYLHHHSANHPGMAPGPFLLLFVIGWMLMTMAMMLPTSVPLLTVFHTIAGRRDDRALLMLLVVV